MYAWCLDQKNCNLLFCFAVNATRRSCLDWLHLCILNFCWGGTIPSFLLSDVAHPLSYSGLVAFLFSFPINIRFAAPGCSLLILITDGLIQLVLVIWRANRSPVFSECLACWFPAEVNFGKIISLLLTMGVGLCAWSYGESVLVIPFSY